MAFGPPCSRSSFDEVDLWVACHDIYSYSVSVTTYKRSHPGFLVVESSTRSTPAAALSDDGVLQQCGVAPVGSYSTSTPSVE